MGKLSRALGRGGSLREPGRTIRVVAVKGQIAVVDFEAERRHRRAVDAAAVIAPQVVGVPASDETTIVPLAGEPLALPGDAPAVPVAPLPLEHGHRAVGPVIKVPRPPAGGLFPGERGGL